MEKIIVRNKYSPIEKSVLICDDVSLTQQHFKESANINSIMKKCAETGMPPVQKLNPSYGDFSSGTDYHSALNSIKDMREEFEALPAHVKKRFHQNPGEILDFMMDQDNREEAIELGLIDDPEKNPVKVGEEIKRLEKKIDDVNNLGEVSKQSEESSVIKSE